MLVFFVPKFSFAKIGETFRLEMGQQIGLRKRFIVFQPNSIVLASNMAFFSKFSFRWSFFFFAPKFSLRQISATFRLEIGRWVGLPRRILIFQPNSIVSAYGMAFFQKNLFWCSFYFALEFKFKQICAAFQLEMGQRTRLRKRFIIFQVNSMVSASEITFFQKLSIRCSFYFEPEFRFTKIYAAFWLEIGKRARFCKRLIIFQPNCIVLAFEIIFFLN